MGNHKYVETPEKMFELFQEYIIKTKANPFKVKDWVGKDGNEILREKEKPLTMVGFEYFCFEKGVIGDLSHYFCNLEKRYSDYVSICRTIRLCISQDQIEGGMAMIYNPSITQRLNGLTEKIHQTNIEQPLFPDKDKD